MKVSIKPGTYIVAISGGVDSVVLLNMLMVNKLSNMNLVVAHFDHGIRDNSAKDREFVQQLAKKYEIPFEYAEGELGPSASEATARSARYSFLRVIKQKYKADAIITAHHQDDVLETMIMNLLRGTGRKGLTSLQSKGDINRPLLGFTKQQLIEYALQHKLQWREDESNQDESYTRNWIRHKIIPKLTKDQKEQLLRTHTVQAQNNQLIDDILHSFIDIAQQERLKKILFTTLPYDITLEVTAHWLRVNNIKEFDKKMLERVVIGAKTLPNGKKVILKKGLYVLMNLDEIVLHTE